MRRLFFVRVAIGVALVVSLLILGPILVLAQILSVTGLGEPSSGVLAAVLLIGLFIAMGTFGRGARRFAVPFGNLIEAAGKVEAGDYSARVETPRRGIRELRVLTASFNSMAARLETDEEQRRTLLADVSHELRTPLAILRGELEAMIDGIHPIDEAHLIAAVDQIEMLTKLVEDLRTLALAEAGTLAMHPEPTDVSILCHEVAASFESLAAENDVRLELSMAEDLTLVDVDPLRIRQVIGNLVANSLRYAPAGSAVSIAARTGPGRVDVSVADHGRGIDPELLPHLFERFAKSADSRGSGLGLAIARRLVEAHGGTITARSPESGGTEILVTLPTSDRT
jgi:two-component system sensor histidine kinase BaeS